MAIEFAPVAPYQQIVTNAATTAIALLCLYSVLLGLKRLPHFANGFAFGQKGPLQTGSISLTLLGLMMLIPAAHNPIWVEHQKTTAAHIVLAVDVSDSVLRGFDNWQAFKLHMSEHLITLMHHQGQSTQNEGVVSLVLFTEQASLVWQQQPFAQTLTRWQQVSTTNIPAGHDTSIATGLITTLETIQTVGRSSTIVLFTDGHQINGDASAIAQQIATGGTPVYTVPLSAELPAVAIKAANLNDEVEVEQITYLRGLMVNRQKNAMKGELTVTQNLGTKDAKQAKSNVTLAANGQGVIRHRIDFQKRGLNHLTLAFDEANSNQPHIRRLYTLVKGPAKILSIAGDRRWESALPQASIIPATPSSLTVNTPFSDYDGIVISAVAATDFDPAVLDKLASAVSDEGTGLLLINGTQFDEEQPTVLMSYRNTAIDPLLPVSSEPRPESYEPPSRNIVIMIDTSGSMGGGRLTQAKAIASYIIQTYMRPQDTLDLIAFDTGAQHLVKNEAMDQSAKRKALQKLSSIVTGGGTNPERALALLNGRTMDECGLIFISDGDFGAISARPDCAATAFAIGKSPGTMSNISAIADPVYVNGGFNPARIKLPYFEPESRNKHFEPGPYTPASIQFRSHLAGTVPSLELEGTAISYLRTGAELVAIRPKFRDPVLSYIQRGNGYVGTFTTALPRHWLSAPAGRQAIKKWVDEILPFSLQKRYKIKVTDLGNKLKFTMGVFQGDRVARLNNIQMLIKLKNQPALAVAFSAHPDEPGRFIGDLNLNEVTAPGAGMMYISETGKDALPRQQRIPINLVTTKTVRQSQTEDQSSGTNFSLLQKLAFDTGGEVIQQLNQDLIQFKPQRTKEQPLWFLFGALSMLFYLAAISVTRLES